MKKGVKARIRWVPFEEGGRASPPNGPVYSTVAHFRHDAPNWPDEAWSLVVRLDQPSRGSREVIATVDFLVDYGPPELLRLGNTFELVEGKRVVARGEVIE